MTDQKCGYPVIQHRVQGPDPVAGATRTRLMFIYECPDIDCTIEPDEHSWRLPCRWSWPYAHGKAFDGRAFPKRRCPSCDHIRRAGPPHEDVAVESR